MRVSTSLRRVLPVVAAIRGRAVAASRDAHAQAVSCILTPRMIGAVLAIAIHAWLPAAHGQAVYNDHPLSNLIDQLPSPAPGSNGQRFTVPVTASATMDYFGHNTLAWFATPPSDINWEGASSSQQSFEYFAFRSADSVVRNAFISATDGNGSLTDAYSATIKVKEFSLDSVNLDPRKNVIALTGAAHVWTMNNSSYKGELAKPQFTAPYPLTFTASGSSTLDSWDGNIPSRTDLFVPSGGTFTLLRCGNIASSSVVDSLRWDSSDGNTADIDGSTLSIDKSFVTFVTGEIPTVAGGAVTAGMVVRNNGTLNIAGSDGTLEYARLHVNGGLLVDSSTLQVAHRGHLSTTNLFFNNATVNFLDDVQYAAITAGFAEFQGTTTITANNPLGYTASGFSAGFSLANSSAVVNIAGTGPTFADGLFELAHGTVNVAAGASLVLRSNVSMFSNTAGNVNIASGGELDIGNKFTLYTKNMTLHNEGTISAYGGLVGGGTLSGTGTVVVDGTSSIVAVDADRSSFTIDGNLSFLSDSTLGLIIRPSLGTSQHVSVAGLQISTPFNNPEANLLLTIQNDTVLADGTKFLLVDYDTLPAGEHFAGFADGSIFTQGLNSYQIRYSDAAYDALNPSVITLTVVPEPTTCASLLAGLACGGVSMWRRRERA